MVTGGRAPTPTPVRCPVITDPSAGLADPADFGPLLARLHRAADVRGDEEFPRGTLRPDGRLDLCKQGVGPVTTPRLVRAAAHGGHARHLLLGTNALGDEGTAAVLGALGPDHPVRTLYLGCNRITATGAGALADFLATDRTVRALWLKRNPIGDDGVLRLCRALSGNPVLRTLDLVNVGLTVRGLTALADTLAHRDAPMERLFLSGNGFGPDAVPALAELVHDAGVRELYLAVNRLGDAGVSALARAVTGLPLTLNLGGNGLTPLGAAEVAYRSAGWWSLDLGRAPSERALGAVGNVLGDHAAAAFAAVLPARDLRRLELRHTGITGRGARLLLAAAREHHSLEHLGLDGGVPRRIRRELTAVLRPSGRPLTPAHPDILAIGSVYR